MTCIIIRTSPDQHFGLQRQTKSPHSRSSGRQTSRRIDQLKWGRQLRSLLACAGVTQHAALQLHTLTVSKGTVMLVMMTTTMMWELNSSQSRVIIYLTHISVYKHTERTFKYIICTVHRQTSPGRLRWVLPTAAAFKRVTNCRYKALQIALLIRDSPECHFVQLALQHDTLNIYPLWPNCIMCVLHMNGTQGSLRSCN
jgi:hypothetical protein